MLSLKAFDKQLTSIMINPKGDIFLGTSDGFLIILNYNTGKILGLNLRF